MKRMFAILLVMMVCLTAMPQTDRVITGDERTDIYLPILRGKRVALYSNHTGMACDKHVLDLMVDSGVNVSVIFSPEHGFRGSADAGERVGNSVDRQTGVEIVSLYGGKGNKLSASNVNRFDILVVDIQDVGTRFYTYHITMCKLMEACARHDKEVIILDRPNPNGHYVDGPILNMRYKSGVGVLPIPVVHGMTLGELALMVNSERWLADSLICRLSVVECLNYTHRTLYRLPISPSPNLPEMKSIYLYPSTCLFEATPLSLGRGTKLPFQLYGHPDMKECDYQFTPRSMPGAKYPPLQDRLCHGVNLSAMSEEETAATGFSLRFIIDAYQRMNIGDRFFTSFFEKLIGVDYVRRMIEEGKGEDEIRAKWSEEVEQFKSLRQQYLLYKE